MFFLHWGFADQPQCSVFNPRRWRVTGGGSLAKQPGKNTGGEKHHPSPHGEMLPKTERLCQAGRKSCEKGSCIAQKLRSWQGALLSKPYGVYLEMQSSRFHRARAPRVLQHHSCCRRSEWRFLPFCNGFESLISIKCLLWKVALICYAVGTGVLLNGHRE